MSADLSSILKRVKTTSEAPNPDDWMAAAAPNASESERAALRAKLEALPKVNFKPDPSRIRALQASLKDKKIAAFVVPRADEHMGEYLLPANERLYWLTGFTGSAGLAIICQDQAALFIDGRYTIQGPAQTDASVITCRHFQKPPAHQWLCETLKKGDMVGYDPSTFAVSEAQKWAKTLNESGIIFRAISNPVDALWLDQPDDPYSAIRAHDLAFAGQSSEEKRLLIGAGLKAVGFDCVVLNQLDSIAWLLNMRGGDTPNTPLIHGFVILAQDGHATWFVDSLKFTQGVREALGNTVTVRPVAEFYADLAKLSGKTVMLDPDTAPMRIEQALQNAGAIIGHAADPCIALKAKKNDVEKDGTRQAHIRDGVAMVKFLHWFDHAVHNSLYEMEAADELEAFRAQSPLYRGPSFGSISAAGANAALPHYRSTPEGNRKIEQNSLYLVDSGGQYCDGTTDITRTIAVGDVPHEQKKHFTLVLKGHIALSTMRFPKGTVGAQLDAIARQFLWREALNYDHGTGHGVGSYLGVHETAARIAPLGQVALAEGMLLSNEPGYYAEGSHGIRIENLLFVTQSATEGWFEFEDVTLCPIDHRAIDKSLLTPAELHWLNAYHARVWDRLSPHVDGDVKAWLREATSPL